MPTSWKRVPPRKPTANRVQRVTARAHRRVRPAYRTLPRSASYRPVPHLDPLLPEEDLSLGPYLDYARRLTPEGGVLIAFKTVDDRLRYTIWRILAWTLFTGFAAWLSFRFHDGRAGSLAVAALAGLVNWLIVKRPIEIYRSVEIRPDCLILDHADIFWLTKIESLPEFSTEDEAKFVLRGVYGTRLVEYLTVYRFEDYDCQPEVFAAHLHDAMKQLWADTLGDELFDEERPPGRRREPRG
jgi:hypothetical protein